MTLVDTNVVLDILVNDPVWRSWSSGKLEQQSQLGPLLVTDTVYAEVSAGFLEQAQVDRTLAALGLVLERIPRAALFMAGRAFRQYRRAGGLRSSLLPDFFIGAHARVARRPILTRDVRRYRAHFPDVELIAPEA